MKKKQVGFFTALSNKCSSLAGLLVFAVLVLNLVVVYIFEKSRDPQVIYSVERVLVNTNLNSSVSVPANSSVPSMSVPSSPLSPSVPVGTNNVVRLSTSYDFFTYEFTRHVKMFDRFFSEGSLTSYGRIVTIFPDRILLDDGSYINNSKWTNSLQPSQPSKL